MINRILKTLIVIILIITAYMLGRLSMQKDLYSLTGRIYELEMQVEYLKEM